MPRGELRVEATLKVGPQEEDRYDLALWLRAGGGPTLLGVGPGKDQKDRLSIGEMIKSLAKMLGLEAEFGPVASLEASWPWSKLFAIQIVPELTVEVSSEPSVALVLELFEGTAPKSGIHLPGTPPDLKWLTIEPNFVVYQLVLSYDKKRGVDLRALVEFEEQKNSKPFVLVGGTPPAPKKELVSYPFPTPPPGNANLQVRYLGLGQRFGPDADLTAEDPLKKLFEELEDDLASNNPSVLLEKLVDDYYHPDRDWFFGAHVLLRGWEVRAVLSDPVLYGLEVSCTSEQFAGLSIEILYQKLGSGVGVFYGELSMPTKYRTIQLGVVSLTLPSFKLWIYTNGDFKVSVGWPLGPNSIGVQVYIFTGGGGFYFAKLRSADKPASGGQVLLARGSSALTESTNYNPIIEFGIGLWFGVGRSFSAGPFSAELSVTMRGTFQGVLAWKAPDQENPNSSSSISKSPDYYWFAATLGIVGVLQGEVDLAIVKLSVLVRIEAVAGVAFETGYGTFVLVAASVDVRASLRIVFITITVGFRASIEQSFKLSDGEPASIDGPRNPFFHGMNDWVGEGVESLEAGLRESAVVPASATAVLEAPAAEPGPTTIEVGFLLQPTAVYSGEGGSACGFAGLVVGTVAPPPTEEEKAPKSPYEKLVGALARWLLAEFASDSNTWTEVAAKLEKIGEEPAWYELLTGFVVANLRFELHGIELAKAEAEVAFLPMLEDLQLSWTGHDEPVVLGEQARTRLGYEKVVADYFAELALAGLGPSPPATDAVAAVDEEPAPTGPPLIRFIFDDYFLMISRHLAQELAAEEEKLKEEKKAPEPGKMPSPAQAMNAAGIGSRYLLNGMRLPDPLRTPEKVSRKELASLPIASGYALDGQQFAIVGSGSECEATLGLRKEPGPIGKASIAFASGDGATSSMPVAAVPPAPIPTWSGPGAGLGAAAATIDLEAIPPATEQDIWVAVRGRLPWQGPKAELPSVVPLPPEIAAWSGKGALSLTVQTEAPKLPPPGTRTSPKGANALPVQPALLIPVGAHRVDRVRSTDLKEPSARALAAEEGAEAESPYVPFVYRLDGTDEATRAQIAAALAAGALAGGSLAVLYDDPKAGYRSDEVEPKRVLLAKANLSTTSQPAGVSLPLRLAAGPELGPTTANLEQVPDFARLLWELSVVQAGGFYLRYETADGKGLPDSIFHSAGELPEDEEATGDSAELTLAITFPAGTSVAAWHNAFLVPLESGFKDTLYVGLADAAAGTPLRTAHPSYPPGCAGFEGTWQLADLLRADAGGEIYGADWVAQLYHQLQFRVAGTKAGSPVKFDPSLWSLSLSPVKKDPEETGPGDNYRQVLPAYRFIEGSEGTADPYAAVGGAVELGFRVGDVFGNVLESGGHEGPVSLLYSDPLIGPGEWPGVRVAHRFTPGVEGGKGPQLRFGFAFDPAAVVKRGEGQEDPDASREQALAALERYATAIAQLEDPRTEAVIATSIPGLLGGLGPIDAELCKFAREIVTQLEKVVTDGTAEPLAWNPEWPIKPKQLAKLEGDLEPLTVEARAAPAGRSGLGRRRRSAGRKIRPLAVPGPRRSRPAPERRSDRGCGPDRR